MKTLVIGLGNPILSDDSLGLRVSSALLDKIGRNDITISKSETGGLDLLEMLCGYDRAIIIDSIKTAEGIPGSIYLLTPNSLTNTCHMNSSHFMDLNTSLEIGNLLGMPLPHEVLIYAIEAQDINTFSENCTPAVEKAINICVEKIIQQLKAGSPCNTRSTDTQEVGC